jgi:hypothetical protein
MAITAGGSFGVTFPDSSNTPATGVTAQLGPAITDTANVMSILGKVVFDGTNGIYANGSVYTAARTQLSQTYSANAANTSLNVTSISGYVAGKSDITITINSGVYLYSTTLGTAGLTLTGGATGDTVTIVNNGYIMGKGGNADTASAAQAGTLAISLGFNTTINNTNASAYIGGGGGGGRGTNYGGGGGGAGAGNGNVGGFGASTGGTGGAVGNAGTSGVGVSQSICGTNEFASGGGGGGRIFAGTGGASAFGGTGGGSGGGGGGGGQGSITYGGAGGSANAAGGAGNSDGGGGGGGWGASGGSSVYGAGGAGGRAVTLNGNTVTWTSGDTTRVYGAIA